MSAGRGGGTKAAWGRIANAKSLGWAIYAVGFAIWLFGYLSAGHAPLFDWNATTPWWISSLIPNLEAEIGLALMFASILPALPWAGLFPFALFLVLGAITLAWWGFLAWWTCGRFRCILGLLFMRYSADRRAGQNGIPSPPSHVILAIG